MAKELHQMSEDERAEYYEAHKDEELFSPQPVRVRVRRGDGASTMFSLRIPSAELTRIGEAARARGMTVSEFIRKSSLAAAENEDEAERAAAIGAAREKARELSEALSKL